MAYVNDSSLKFYLDGNDFLNSPPTTTWLDRSTYGNNATPTNFGYTTSSGAVGDGSVKFDGIDDNCTILNSSSFDFRGNDFTIGFNVTLNTLTESRNSMQKNHSNL